MQLNHLQPPAILLSVFAVWETLCVVFSVPNYLFPSASEVLKYCYINRFGLYTHISTTVLEAAIGLCIALFVAAILSLVCLTSRMVMNTLIPLSIAIKSMPIVALAPLFVIWFGNGLLPKSGMAAIIAFFPIFIGLLKGVLSVPPSTLNLFDLSGASWWQTLWWLRLPYSGPFFFTGLRTGITLTMIGAIVSEFAGADRGIGFFILRASRKLDTTGMFAGILLASLVSVAAYYIVRAIEVRLLPWAKEQLDENW